jgi:hypothetical protein
MTMGTAPQTLDRRLRLKRAYGDESPYMITPTETDIDGNASEASSADGYNCSPVTPVSVSSLSIPRPSAWTAQNMSSHSANSSINIGAPSKTSSTTRKLLPASNPLLSAIPRSTGLIEMSPNPWNTSSTSANTKRRAKDIDADDEYDGEESTAATDDKASEAEKSMSVDRDMEDVVSVGGAEKKAAWLLMKLSVKDGEFGGGGASAAEGGADADGHRVKRRRATSM